MNMKKSVLTGILGVICLLIPSCKDYPVDDDGRLMTTRGQCYMSMFELLGPDNRTVLVSAATIDTVTCTVTATAKFGTNIKHVKPYCSLVTDAILEPEMGVWTDFTQPCKYTVVSGNRKIRKEYTITVSLQGE
jgi:hypothetical protein